MSEVLEFLKSTEFMMAAGMLLSGGIFGFWFHAKLADYLANRERRRIKHPYLFR